MDDQAIITEPEDQPSQMPEQIRLETKTITKEDGTKETIKTTTKTDSDGKKVEEIESFVESLKEDFPKPTRDESSTVTKETVVQPDGRTETVVTTTKSDGDGKQTTETKTIMSIPEDTEPTIVGSDKSVSVQKSTVVQPDGSRQTFK